MSDQDFGCITRLFESVRPVNSLTSRRATLSINTNSILPILASDWGFIVAYYHCNQVIKNEGLIIHVHDRKTWVRVIDDIHEKYQ
jgi:hypothetical protein